MKKIISFILILIFAFSLVSCQNQSKSSSGDVDIVWLRELDFKAQFVRANVEYTPNFPYAEVIHSKEELNSYIERFAVDTKNEYDGSISFDTATQKYTDEYFENNQLVMCMIEETSGSIRHKVEKVHIDRDIEISIFIKRDIPEICTDDIATWHILVETEKTITPDYRVRIVGLEENTDGYYKTINFMDGPIGISFVLDMEKWMYKIIDDEKRWGIEIYSQDTWNSSIDIYYCEPEKTTLFDDENANYKPVTIGNYSGIADSQDDWRIIKLNTSGGGYYIHNNSSFDWWEKYGEEALKIFDTLVLFDVTQTNKKGNE